MRCRLCHSAAVWPFSISGTVKIEQKSSHAFFQLALAAESLHVYLRPRPLEMTRKGLPSSRSPKTAFAGHLEALFVWVCGSLSVRRNRGSGRRALPCSVQGWALAAESMHIRGLAGWLAIWWPGAVGYRLHFLLSAAMSTSPLCGRLAIFHIGYHKKRAEIVSYSLLAGPWLQNRCIFAVRCDVDFATLRPFGHFLYRVP